MVRQCLSCGGYDRRQDWWWLRATDLERWAERSTTAQALAVRARLTLLCAQGRSNKEVAGSLQVSAQMVCKWRGRFIERRLDGLLDEPRPDAPRRISDRQIERVIVRTLEPTPRDGTHWSLCSMAAAEGLSPPRSIALGRHLHCKPIRPRRLSYPVIRCLLKSA